MQPASKKHGNNSHLSRDKAANLAQVAEMKNENLPGLSPLWLIVLAMVLGTFIIVMVPVSIATGDNIKSSDWIGFSGSVIAGAIALLAAVLAWFAVQRQITAQEDAEKRAAARLTEQRDTDMANAKEAAKIVLTHPIHAAAAVMKVTCQYLDAVARQPPRGIGLQGYAGEAEREAQMIRPTLDKVMGQLKATMSNFAIAEAWKDLGIEDKLQLSRRDLDAPYHIQHLRKCAANLIRRIS